MPNAFKYFICLSAWLLTWGLYAQDIHFSQFYMSPLNLNPAMTGLINGSQRVIVNYRNQWAPAIGSASYNTYSASYDRRLPTGQEDYFGVGATLWSDVAGDTKFGSSQAKLSFSFSKKIGGSKKKAHFISAGVEGGFTQRRVRTGDLRWLTQVDLATAEFCSTCGTPDAIPNNNFFFGDLSAGLMWFSTLGDRTNVYAGAAMHHINEPNVSFFDGVDNLYNRKTFHAGGEYPLNHKISLKPNIIYMMQGPHSELNAGASMRFKAKSSGTVARNGGGKFFEIGTWYRLGSKADGGINSDAIILAARFDVDQYGIGLSYDYNISGLSQAAPGNGSFELSLVYLFGDNNNRGVFCPVF